MHFLRVAMCSQRVELRIGDFDFGDLFPGKVGGQPPLPVWVGAFDFAFGLRRGGLPEADVIELERPAQLGQGVGLVREKEAVVTCFMCFWAGQRMIVCVRGCSKKSTS